MMKKVAVFAGVSMLTLSGCVIHVSDGNRDYTPDWKQRQESNQQYIADLKLGTDYQIVTSSLGKADFVDSFELGGKAYRVLLYRTHSRHGDGETTRDESTPLVFTEGKLVGIGETALEVFKK